MQRRDFLKLSSLLMMGGALPAWSRSALATSRPLLSTPSLLEADLRNRIDLTAMTGNSQWQNQAVATWGYNGAYLGPAIKIQQHRPVTLAVYNQLPQATTVHWHGLVVDGDSDGGPQGIIAPGAKREVTLQVDQPAATCWYHPHPHMNSGYQVAKGLAGLLIIDDEQSKTLPLPSQWGVDDIPLIFQDKQLNRQGNDIDYQLDIIRAAVGWFGDMMLTNGSQYPQIAVRSGWVRFRLLNACNARAMNVQISDRRPIYVIASDGGLLAEPVKVETLALLPGERFEIMLEINTVQPFDLLTLPVTQMGMTLPPFDQPLPLLKVLPLHLGGSASLPDKLALLPAIPSTDGLTRRQIRLSMDAQLDQLGMKQLMQRYGHRAMGGAMHAHTGHQPASAGEAMHAMPSMGTHHAGHNSLNPPITAYDFHQGNKINGRAYHADYCEWQVPLGQQEVWEITGEGDMMLHPFHIHGTQYRILSENGQAVAAHRQGWKDIVSVEGSSSQVLVSFPKRANKSAPYMAHCHLLEHEDTGMMMSFTVQPSAV